MSIKRGRAAKEGFHEVSGKGQISRDFEERGSSLSFQLWIANLEGKDPLLRYCYDIVGVPEKSFICNYHG